MNYCHWTGCNLLPTNSDGIVSPDIIWIVHKTKGKIIYSKQFLPQLHIIRFQKGSAIYRYWAYTAAFCSSALTRHSNLVTRAALRKMTSQKYHKGSKMNSDGPQRTPDCPPRSQDAWTWVNNSHFFHSKNTVKKMNYGTEATITYPPQMQTA